MQNLYCELPQLSANILSNQFENNQNSNVMIVLGGRAPDISWLSEASLSFEEIWAADSGGDICKKAGLQPKYLIGDFDSICEKEKEWLVSHGTETIKYPIEKDLTDYQLCLKIASQRGVKNVYVTGGWGGRFDHTFSNLYSASYGMSLGVRVICLSDEIESLFYIYAEESIEICYKDIPNEFSLIPLGLSSIVSVSGAKWNLSFSEITQKLPYAISNKALDQKIKICAHEGAIGVYSINTNSQPC
jgi:thiamine pyrophosphokinase